MSLAHEYSIIGHSRASIGRYLGAIAALAASGITAAIAALVEAFSNYGVAGWGRILLLIPITAGIVYAAVHWLFDRFGWRALALFSQVPNIHGEWTCFGQSLDMQGNVTYEWNGKIIVSQHWEKIRVRIETGTSASNSVSAALIPEPDGRWLVMYRYQNEPRMGNPELQAHIGHCEIRFEKDLKTGEGEYFNAKGRGTFGRMQLNRSKR